MGAVAGGCLVRERKSPEPAQGRLDEALRAYFSAFSCDSRVFQWVCLFPLFQAIRTAIVPRERPTSNLPSRQLLAQRRNVGYQKTPYLLLPSGEQRSVTSANSNVLIFLHSAGGFSGIGVDGNSREERQVAAVRYRSLDQAERRSEVAMICDQNTRDIERFCDPSWLHGGGTL